MTAGEPSAEVEAVLRERLAALSMTQKVLLLTGADFWSLHPEPSVGLRRLVFSDGPVGVRGETWDERDPSANVPSPTALAASWDLDRIERIGGLLAGEARRKGVDVLLAPTVNLQRSPYGGRHFECFSEDPLLTAVVGAAYARGLQSGGVGACAKHFVANDSETERFTVDVHVDEPTLREVYLAPFAALVGEAGVWTVMAAYNAVAGVTMTASPLLREVLKDEWGFDGVVVSDWYAARSLAAAGEGLLDLVMPGPTGPWGAALVEAVTAGVVPEEAVDDKVLRLLRLAARVGALDGVAPAAPTGEPWTPATVAAELRRAAAAGFVLARNAGPLLPLDATRLRRVAVLGPHAEAPRTLGGGSATVAPPYVISPVEGLEAVLGSGVEVVTASGVPPGERLRPAPMAWLAGAGGRPGGINVRFLDADGRALAREARRATTLIWSGTVTAGVVVGDVAAVELQATLRAPQAGTYRLGGSGLGAFRLTIDGREVLDAATDLPAGADFVEAIMRPPQAWADVELDGGQEAALVLRHEPAAANDAGGAEQVVVAVQLNADRVREGDAELDHAVALAGDADVAVVVVGTTEDVESEGFDRADLALPGRQDELVARVAAANPRTVAVVNAGAPVLLPWADDVAAVLLAWFPGQEFGHALADVLLGAVEPGGRLPTTWPLADAGQPPVTPVGGRLAYDEGPLIGYRAYLHDGRTARYAFGHGLGYTDWAYESVAAPPTVDADDDVSLVVRVRNRGERRGRDVVQVYASRPGRTDRRPPWWLAAFAPVEADAGEAVDVSVTVPARALARFDPATGWTVDPGAYRLEIGRSVGDRRLRAEVSVAPTA